MRFMMRLMPLTLLVVIAVVAGLGARPGSARASAAQGPGGFCESVDLPVALSPRADLTQNVSGTYCAPRTWAAGPHEIDVLTPGASYNRLYWDWPVDPGLYSYVDKTLAAGRATFDYDRIGTGASSHPPSCDITINTDAYVLHQVVTWARG